MAFAIQEPSGEPLCLSFVNTVSSRGAERPSDRLERFQDLRDWLRRSGVLSEGATFSDDPRVLERAKGLREAIHSIGSALAGGTVPPVADVDELNWSVQRAVVAVRLTGAGDRLAWDTSALRGSVTGALGLIALSAAELFASERADRVRECKNSECGWLFLDLSKNRSRKWCDMADCGNLEKARRYYAKKKASTQQKSPGRSASGAQS